MSVRAIDSHQFVVLRAALVRAHDNACPGSCGIDVDCSPIHEAILLVNAMSADAGGLTGMDLYDATERYNNTHHYPGLPEDECLEFSTGKCSGRVEARPSLSGTGTPIARCDAHWEEAVERDAEHRRVFPDSPIAPSWFDPAAAGERWDEDY